MHWNSITGTVYGNVVQLRDLHVHITAERGPLTAALHSAAVCTESGSGVAVAPELALVLGPDGLVLVPGEHETYACLLPDVRSGDELVRTGDAPGAPVLNRRTGAVCALVGADGIPLAVPELPELARVRRANHAWLDLLSPEQLRASGWRHPGPVLRTYLRGLAEADREHRYLSLRAEAPPLSAIYLNRHTTRQDETAPERVDAETLLHRHDGV
ncbi:hypothetical protein, partial [Crossiella equi]